MRLWQLATRQWVPPQKFYTRKRECRMSNPVDKHTIRQICSLKSVEMCKWSLQDKHVVKVELFIQLAARSAATPLWHLGCFSEKSNICCGIHMYWIVLVWWHPAICNMLQSVSKQNIKAFVAIYTVTGDQNTYGIVDLGSNCLPWHVCAPGSGIPNRSL